MEDSPHVHRYQATCRWEGSTADGYSAYDRAHVAHCPPSATQVRLSSDPAFGGDAALLNPEQLVVLAASSCQLLSFLAVAARAHVEVLRYEDDAEGIMPDGLEPMLLTRIVLRPRIVVGPQTSIEHVAKLVEVAHRECFIANSLRTEVVVEPLLVVG